MPPRRSSRRARRSSAPRPGRSWSGPCSSGRSTQLWVDHLTELDDFRRGVGLRGYAGTDPLVEFKREAFKLYEELRGFIRHQVAATIFRVNVQRRPPVETTPMPTLTPQQLAALRAGGPTPTNGDGAGDGAAPGAGAVTSDASGTPRADPGRSGRLDRDRRDQRHVVERRHREDRAGPGARSGGTPADAAATRRSDGRRRVERHLGGR